VKQGNFPYIFKDFPGLIKKFKDFPGQQKNPGLFQDVATLYLRSNFYLFLYKFYNDWCFHTLVHFNRGGDLHNMTYCFHLRLLLVKQQVNNLILPIMRQKQHQGYYFHIFMQYFLTMSVVCKLMHFNW